VFTAEPICHVARQLSRQKEGKVNESDRHYVLFGGITSLVLGLWLLTRLGATLPVVVLGVGMIWFVQGALSLLGMLLDESDWGAKLFGGVLGIAAGLLMLQSSVASTATVPAAVADLIGILGLMFGISTVIVAAQGEGWGTGVSGAISIVIALLLLFGPPGGFDALVWLTAFLLLVEGIVGIILGLVGSEEPDWD
jgi:uncharacterized membrane protein HdeD (DUF308 family)